MIMNKVFNNELTSHNFAQKIVQKLCLIKYPHRIVSV